MATQQPLAGGAQNSSSFSLFPNPNVSRPPPPVIRLHPNPRPKRSASRERARQEQEQQLRQNHEQQQQHQRLNTPPGRFSDSESPESSPPRPDTTTQVPTTTHTPLQFDPVSSSVASPQPVASIPGRSSSVRSRSSIAKPPLTDDSGVGAAGPSSSAAPAPLRSIFPTYNPDLPLDQQAYGPTQMSPSHIPRAVISRQSYYDPEVMSIGQAYTSTTTEPVPELPRSAPPPRYRQQQQQQQQQDTTPFSAVHRAHPRASSLSPPVIPTTSTTEELKTFWKATNGWKAAPSEGRVFCLKLSQLKDAPVYTLSSASQPFYTLRLDPTSASALVSLSRHDPAKTYKLPKPELSSSSPSSPGGRGQRDSKHWQEALRTTMEEESRRRPPGDGLVALLMPSPAARMALARADEPHLVAVAERECARLVWDEDGGRHHLVHPALAAPFAVTVRRSPAWSRVEYTLEHHESPRHLARLTRDGTGGGWLEVDTAVAAHVEAYYIIDVAVAALLLVAAADERSGNAVTSTAGAAAGAAGAAGMETFEPPPRPPAPAAAARSESRGSGRFSRLSTRREDRKKRRPMEEFELDLESQDGSLTKGGRARSRRRKRRAKEEEDKLPFLLRAGIRVAKGVFKCVIWVLTALFRVLFSCVRSKY